MIDPIDMRGFDKARMDGDARRATSPFSAPLPRAPRRLKYPTSGEVRLTGPIIASGEFEVTFSDYGLAWIESILGDPPNILRGEN